MQALAPTPRISVLSYLLHAGGPDGFGLLVLGLLLTSWGLLNLVFVRNRPVLLAQALLSFVPLGLGFLGLCNGLSLFLDLASASGPPPWPEVIAETVGRALAHGIFGAASTGISAIIGIAALSKNRTAPKQSQFSANSVAVDP
jgi:hypothetical protein